MRHIIKISQLKMSNTVNFFSLINVFKRVVYFAQHAKSLERYSKKLDCGGTYDDDIRTIRLCH